MSALEVTWPYLLWVTGVAYLTINACLGRYSDWRVPHVSAAAAAAGTAYGVVLVFLASDHFCTRGRLL
jgi:hypothetical protein